MNPFLERHWGSVHAKLISLLDDEIGRQLPADLVSRPEERIAIDELSPSASLRPDVTLSEAWKTGNPAVWQPANSVASGVTIAEPQRVWVEQAPERWIEIRTADGNLVTAIEILSPANKSTSGFSAYRQKQRVYLQSLANLVEIDLLRGGLPVVAAPPEAIQEKSPGTCYHVCVSRAATPLVREVYSCPIRERLPAFRVPLRATDPDAVLDLQPLIDRCYIAGRYHLSPHDRLPDPPLPASEAAWVEDRLRAVGLR